MQYEKFALHNYEHSTLSEVTQRPKGVYIYTTNMHAHLCLAPVHVTFAVGEAVWCLQ